MMDSVHHELAFKTLNVRHLIEVSPETTTLFREIRYCVIALAAAYSIVSIVKTLDFRTKPS